MVELSRDFTAATPSRRFSVHEVGGFPRNYVNFCDISQVNIDLLDVRFIFEQIQTTSYYEITVGRPNRTACAVLQLIYSWVFADGSIARLLQPAYRGCIRFALCVSVRVPKPDNFITFCIHLGRGFGPIQACPSVRLSVRARLSVRGFLSI